MTNLKEQLIGVKEALLKHGRNRGYLKDDNGCLCLLGASAAAVYGYDDITDSTAWYTKLGKHSDAGPVVRALAAQTPEPKFEGSDITRVFLYNDSTVNDEAVIKLVDAAIEAA